MAGYEVTGGLNDYKSKKKAAKAAVAKAKIAALNELYKKLDISQAVTSRKVRVPTSENSLQKLIGCD
ncbi:hypothetical protein Y032_0090g2369 [Ancylostoma ceylanicum]|uniref:Uncharacterized protein n=1 Tax=Ancylostoma ceylanicum TaxID=53326 RepID=A0A016TMV7_9BILA|nr:hypothetical protein Y032_0090g2369 [Ancylostoma ceylanicum]